MKIGVHFNCQNEGIAVALRALLPGAEVINYHSATDLSEREQAERAAILCACDHVITSHFDGRHGLLSAEALRRSARQCHVLPGFAFAGYHPDMCYVHSDGRMVGSRTGGYHSRIAVAGYLAGMDARDTVALYNHLVFARLDYFAAFEEQVALLCGLWASDGIEAEPLVRAWAARGCFAHTINHPKMIVLLDMARIACARMDVAPENPDMDPASLPDKLARGSMHPVFPEIAASLGIAPEGSFSGGPQNVYTPVQFVSDCFGRYADVPSKDLLATPGVSHAMDALGFSVRVPARRRLGHSMTLMSYHGTLLRQGPSRGQVSHAPLATAEWELPYLRLDCARLPARQDVAGVQGADIALAADKRRVTIMREGAFLCAESHAGAAGFLRPAAAEWEHFLPLSEAELALLHRLVAADWLIEESHERVARQDVAIEPGPALRFGRWRIDLARHFPVAGEASLRLLLDGALCSVREHGEAGVHVGAAASLPEPGRALGLVGAPVFVAPPLLADDSDLAWMRRSAVAAQALDGALQATQALLRRQTDPTVITANGRPAAMAIRFCAREGTQEGESAATWSQAAVRLHVLAAVAPADADFLVPPHVSAEALQAWRALGFSQQTFRWAREGAPTADLLWLDNASIAELPAEALAGCRARIGNQPGTGRRLFWQPGIAPETAATLADLGFEAVDAAALPVIAAVALAAHAGWIVGRTGQVPLVFCRGGTRIIELCDEAGFVQDDWVLSAKLGLRHAILPCAERGGMLVPDAARLARLLGMMADMP